MGEERVGRALVVGSGIAGMAAGMHLAELGIEVVLLERGPAIGGSMHLLDHTFPTDSCGLCLMLPEQPSYCPTYECETAEKVRVVTNAEIEGVEEVAGGYRVGLRKKARYVTEACNGCGACEVVCPEARPHDHEGWVRAEKAIHRPAGARAVPEQWVIDMAYCTRCGKCEDVCPEGAIDLEMEDGEEALEVGAVLLAPGYQAYDATLKGEYGYGLYPNVVTSLEFERQVSLAGSSVGRLERPSDGAAPKRVGFVQCVGSRDPRAGVGYCSTACCMYTAKQVGLAKRVAPELAVSVYHMDIRAMGKGYEGYMAGVQGLSGVKYRRSMPSKVYERPGSKGLVVAYVGEDGRVREEEHDLLVLAVGLGPAAGLAGLASKLGVELDGYGFVKGEAYEATGTGRAGVYVAGASREPKDIPETVVEAVAAAGEVAAYLRGKEQREEVKGERKTPRDVSEEEARVGVYVCACRGELAALEPQAVAEWAAGLPGVAVSRVVNEACSAEGVAEIASEVEAEGLNRLVIGGCSPRQYRAEFGDLMRRVGLDARLLARVNLREQVMYPHEGGNGHGAGLRRKAASLVGMAVAKQRTMGGLGEQGDSSREEREKRALVVGGGGAGMSAALGLARLGIEVELVEREEELGGQWRSIRYQVDGSDPVEALRAKVREVAEESRIRVRLGAEVRAVKGRPGQYRTRVGQGEEEEEVSHGVVVLATGGKPVEVEEYLYGRDPRVLTQRELEEQVSEGTLATVGRVVMVQCVGSREEGRPWCSRVCCTQAMKNALRLKAERPGVEVYVLYREVRTYGNREQWYEGARAAGVVFLRYEEGAKPEVEARSEGLVVRVEDRVLGQRVELEADLVVLSVGVEGETAEMGEKWGVELDEEGWYGEEHGKMKPLDVRGGVYVAGLGQGPCFVADAIREGQGAATRAAVWLAGEGGAREGSGVRVSARLCSYCGLCVEACPYGARELDEEERVAVVDAGLCQGCGVCAVVCPNKATLQTGYEQRQMMAAVDMALI